MATCENCSTSFTPNPNASEVTSTRILCVPCEAERRAEKQRRAAAAAAGKPATGAAPTRAAAPPVPAAQRAAASASGSPAPARAARPAASSPRPAADRSPEPAAAPARAPAATRTSARSARPSAEPEPAAKKAARGPSDVRREAELIKKQQDKWITYGWIVCGALVAIAAVVVFIVRAQRQAIADEITARQEVVAGFLEEVKKYDITVPAQAEAAVAAIDQNKDKWWGEVTAGEIGGIQAKARTNLERQKEVGELQNRLTSAEAAAANSAATPTAELARLRRNMEDLEARGEMVGPEFKARVAALRTNLDRAYVAKLHDEAKSLQGRESLTAFTKAEDETIKLYDLAVKRKNEELRPYFEQHLKEIITESDSLVTQLYPPEALEKLPQTDLLAEGAKTLWQNDGLKGWRIEGGVLQAVGPEPGATKVGLMNVPNTTGWRDFELAMEFELKGNVEMLYRLGRRVDNTVPGWSVTTLGSDAPFKPGQVYTATATVLGSKVVMKIDGFEESWNQDLSWTKSRKGAFAVAMQAGSEIKFTKLKLREIR